MEKQYISKIPLFAGADPDEIFSVLKGSEVRTLKPGEYVYKAGEYGEDCGFIISGSLSVELSDEAVSNREGNKTVLEEGDIFGEIASLSGYVRTADVVAPEPAKVLRISRETLCSLLDKFPSVKEEVDRLYRERVLRYQLQSVTVFKGLPEAAIENLVETASLRSYKKGEIIFHQGDNADFFYMVRYGFIKITETMNNGTARVLAYLKGGHCFGDMALINEGQLRTATATAFDRTELVEISQRDFLHIIESYPRIKNSLKNNMAMLEERNDRIRQNDYLGKTLSFAIDSGFAQSKEMLVVDLTKCIHCDTCVKACSDLHDNHTRLVRKGIRLNNIFLVATSCRHCDDPVCMINCPAGAVNRGYAGEIYCSDSCIGCGKCSRSCPYGNISMITLTGRSGEDTEKKNGSRKRPERKPVKCDMCRDHKFMACEYNCPTGAAQRIDTGEFISDVIGAE